MAAPYARGAQVRIIGMMHGVETNNVLNFGTNLQAWDTDNTRQRLIELGQHVLTCVRETLLPAVTSDWRLLRIETKAIFPTITDPVIETGTVDDAGELGPTSVSFAASLINIRSFVGGRRGRGRLFLPPPGEPQIAVSDIDAPTMVLLAAFLTCLAGKFMGPNKTTDWELGVLSRTDAGPTLANFDVGFRQAASLNPVTRLAILSSRKVGVGS